MPLTPALDGWRLKMSSRSAVVTHLAGAAGDPVSKQNKMNLPQG